MDIESLATHKTIHLSLNSCDSSQLIEFKSIEMMEDFINNEFNENQLTIINMSSNKMLPIIEIVK